jgi:hypothetical protein
MFGKLNECRPQIMLSQDWGNNLSKRAEHNKDPEHAEFVSKCEECGFPSLEYKFRNDDLHEAFKFGIDYYLGKKNHTGRTSGEPRGLGSVLDAFVRGKLIEIAVKNWIESFSRNNKKCILDFDIKSLQEVSTEPDIVEIEENNNKRAPHLFIEIKHTGPNDRWIGLTEEQFKSMEKGAAGRKIYIIYASCSHAESNYLKSEYDLLGMYFKKNTSLPIFSDFKDLNVFSKLEFIISAENLRKYGVTFSAGESLYETSIFKNKDINTIFKEDGLLRKGIKLEKVGKWEKDKIKIPREDRKYDEKYGVFSATGAFHWYKKDNPKSRRDYIFCKSDVVIENEVFGNFLLKKGYLYAFNLQTVGRDPVLKRNNIFISKRRVYQLIKNNLIENPMSVLQK